MPDARSNAHCIEVVSIHSLGKDSLFVSELYDCFGYGRLQDRNVPLRCVHRHLADTTAQTGPCGKDGSSCHAIAACNEQGIAHLAFVGMGRAFEQQFAHLIFLYKRIGGVSLVDTLLTEADVQYAEFADEGLVFGKEKCQLGQLEGQCHRSPDDVGADIITVVFRHQPRWDIDTDNLCR